MDFTEYTRAEEDGNHPEHPDLPTVADFCLAIGISPIHSALRAIDKHNIEHVWLVTESGHTLYYHTEGLKAVSPDARIEYVGAGCIAWDGGSWEYSTEAPVTEKTLRETLEAVREDANSAYSAYWAEKGEE